MKTPSPLAQACWVTLFTAAALYALHLHVYVEHYSRRVARSRGLVYRMPQPNSRNATVLSFCLGGALLAGAFAWGQKRNVRERESARERRCRRKRQMAASRIAHDFNNLLTTIRGNADCADMELPADSPARRYLDDIRLAVDTAGRICDELLAGAESGGDADEPVAVNPILDELLRILAHSHLRRARVETGFTADLPGVRIDPVRLRQVLLNLLTNAAEALGETGGTVRVETGIRFYSHSGTAAAGESSVLPAEPGEYVVVEIADTGCGMPPEVMARVFEPYFTTKAGGRGLGLAAVPEVLRRYGGGLEIESEPDRGTVMRLYLEPCCKRCVAAREPVSR